MKLTKKLETEILRVYGREIKVESNDGEGSEFMITLRA